MMNKDLLAASRPLAVTGFAKGAKVGEIKSGSTVAKRDRVMDLLGRPVEELLLNAVFAERMVMEIEVASVLPGLVIAASYWASAAPVPGCIAGGAPAAIRRQVAARIIRAWPWRRRRHSVDSR